MFANADFQFDFLPNMCYNASIRAVLNIGGLYMAISYKKLWKLLIDRDLKKRDLEEMAGISHYTVNKLNHGDNVTTDVLAKICKALDCTMDDIL